MFGQNDTDEDKVTALVEPSTDDASSVTDTTTAPVIGVSDEPTSAPATDSVTTEEPAATEESNAPVADEPVDTTPVVADEKPTTTNNDVLSSSDVSDEDAELLNLKKQALEELSPLIDQLDQTPEEKFKTTMMMIQATDSANLVKVAHDAALQITDEKVRAQALLDIVNEINYFTQK